jgi:hypothetical protein
MQSWRVEGLLLAVLTFGLVGGCDSGGGGGKPDADEELDGGDDGDTGPIDEPDDDAAMDGDIVEEDTGPCVPTKGCDELEAECGHPEDDCGNPLDCGDDCSDSNNPASEYYTCGGGGEDYKCGCKPKSCDDALVCGTFDDGCGGTLECGDECEGQYNTCGGGDTPYKCGCSPMLGACAGAQCGTAPDACGGTLQCGSHGGGCSDGRTCNGSKQCECKSDAQLCVGRCGSITIDGCSATCTPCPPTLCTGACGGDCTCPGTGALCANGACCTPEPQATTCGSATCGTQTNNCGQVVSCGSCSEGSQCAQGQCVNPNLSAMVGKYAVRSIGFAYADGQGSRSEGYALVNISLRGSDLVMREQACASVVFAKSGSSELPGGAIEPSVAIKFPAIETVLDLSGTRNVPGDKEWFRDTPRPAENALGWRRGRPSYCPAPTTENPRPNPSSSLPGYSETGGRGAKKAWLGGADCKCPEAEIAQTGREPCATSTTPASERAACMADWINLSVPFSPGVPSGDSAVTDCRVIDEDGDDRPGVTINADAGALARATLRTASVTANYLWGDIDTSGARRHTGVYLDLPGVRNSILACIEPPAGWGLAGRALCRASSGKLCPARRPNGERSSPVDFVPLESQQAPGGGEWDCQKLFTSRSSLFQGIPNFSNNYPPESLCAVPQ